METLHSGGTGAAGHCLNAVKNSKGFMQRSCKYDFQSVGLYSIH